MKKLLLATLAITTLATSCRKDDDSEKNGIYKGPAVQVHGGKAWTWVQVKKDGTPERLAIAMDDAAFNTVPKGNNHPDGGAGGHNMDMNSYVLPLHAKAGITPFKHVFLNWNQVGHEPPGIYDIPHFDLHYYMIPSTEREAIPVYEADSMKFKDIPAPAYFPQTYIPGPGGVPQMGAHWLDITSPELNGQKFSQTFIYGSYSGKVIFLEPMITWDFIKSISSTYERAIPKPAKFQKSGYYPTKLRIVKHDGITDFILDDFVYRQQS